jgi:hypothetical protein
MMTPTQFYELPCSPTAVVVGGVTYYRCGDGWYSRGYSSGDVAYIAVDPPPGY